MAIKSGNTGTTGLMPADPSRRKFLGASVTATAIAGAALLGAPTSAAAAQKVSKAAAQYQDRPNDSEKCGGCKHYFFFGSCEVVYGLVSSQGWCKLYKAR